MKHVTFRPLKVKARDARRIRAAEMKYMSRAAGCIWTDYKTNAQIAKELKITPILDKLLEYPLRTVRPTYRTGVPPPSRCCILYIFFNNYKY
jgi:hypothetical protein